MSLGEQRFRLLSVALLEALKLAECDLRFAAKMLRLTHLAPTAITIDDGLLSINTAIALAESASVEVLKLDEEG